MRLRLESGLLEVAVPPSDRAPIDIRLPDRAVRVQPGETRRLSLPVPAVAPGPKGPDGSVGGPAGS